MRFNDGRVTIRVHKFPSDIGSGPRIVVQHEGFGLDPDGSC